VGRKKIDLTGSRFGTLIGLQEIESGVWSFKCDCGEICILNKITVRRNSKVNCGSDVHSPRKSHPETYKRWQRMMTRASWPSQEKIHNSKNYFGRGITVCERWKSFENFLEDMGDCPPGLTIDRIDNDGNYEPGNCRWATYTEQSANKKRSDQVAKNGTVGFVDSIPKCDFNRRDPEHDECEADALYDFLTKMGSWAYGCEFHWKKYRAHEELGIGKGQKLELRK
jgi:hypothetical protein